MTGVETGTCPSQVRRVHAVPFGAMEGVCRMSLVANDLIGGKYPLPTKMEARVPSEGGFIWSGVVCLCYGHYNL